MHELSIAQALISQVERIAFANGASRVCAIRVRIGALSGVEIPLLERAFTIARATGVTARSTLEIEPVGITIACTSCGAETAAAPARLVCDACGDWRVRLVAGDELVLVSVELADDGPPPVEPCTTEDRIGMSKNV